MIKYVQYLNLANGMTTTIPVEELAPGCMLTSGTAFSSGAYVDISKLPIRCNPVFATVPTEAQRALLYYCDSVAGMDPLSNSEHQFPLRCNRNAVGQLAVLCHIGRIFRQFSKCKVAGPLKRIELLLLLQRCSVAEKDSILQIHKPDSLPMSICNAVINAYYGADPWEFFAANFRSEEMVFPARLTKTKRAMLL